MKYILILAICWAFQMNLMAQELETKYHFSAEKILDRAISEGKIYGQYINNATMSSGIYHLKKGTADPQQPHQLDEIYYVIAGTAKLRIEDEVFPAIAGDILFVPAKATHKFEDIEEDLTLLVFFSKKAPAGNE